jgi:hypothetical protein
MICCIDSDQRSNADAESIYLCDMSRKRHRRANPKIDFVTFIYWDPCSIVLYRLWLVAPTGKKASEHLPDGCSNSLQCWRIRALSRCLWNLQLWMAKGRTVVLIMSSWVRIFMWYVANILVLGRSTRYSQWVIYTFLSKHLRRKGYSSPRSLQYHQGT